jgi:hypothetical protein
MMRTLRGGRPDLVSDALRQLWASTERDEVPADFLELLDRLDEARASTDPTNLRSDALQPGSSDGSDKAA